MPGRLIGRWPKLECPKGESWRGADPRRTAGRGGEDGTRPAWLWSGDESDWLAMILRTHRSGCGSPTDRRGCRAPSHRAHDRGTVRHRPCDQSASHVEARRGDPAIWLGSGHPSADQCSPLSPKRSQMTELHSNGDERAARIAARSVTRSATAPPDFIETSAGFANDDPRERAVTSACHATRPP